MTKTTNREADIKMLNFILKLLFPEYFVYQEELEKQIKKEREMLNNER